MKRHMKQFTDPPLFLAHYICGDSLLTTKRMIAIVTGSIDCLLIRLTETKIVEGNTQESIIMILMAIAAYTFKLLNTSIVTG